MYSIALAPEPDGGVSFAPIVHEAQKALATALAGVEAALKPPAPKRPRAKKVIPTNG